MIKKKLDRNKGHRKHNYDTQVIYGALMSRIAFHKRTVEWEDFRRPKI